MTSKPVLVAENVNIVYTSRKTKKSTEAVKDLSLEAFDGEFVSIVGPSGCGKTTFLSAAAGLVKINSGRLQMDGRDCSRGPTRDKAMVFQSAFLLPWRTVLSNIVYGLELQGRDKAKSIEVARDLARLVGLSGFENYYPSEISGGMQQRVNLARALAVDPTILLLDEPFASLDAQTREFMQAELLRIWEASKKTALFVTHQISEAIYLSDRVAVFSARPGTIKAIIPIDLERPRSLSIKRTPQFAALEDEIWGMIEVESRIASSS